MFLLDWLVRWIYDEYCCFCLFDEKVKDIEDMVVSFVKYKFLVLL